MKASIAAVILVFSLILASLPASAQVTAVPRLSLGKNIRATFEEIYPKTLAVLQADFPEDYAVLIAQWERLNALRGSDAARMTTAFVALSELRKKYADHLKNAPKAELSQVIGLTGEFHKAVLTDYGARLCGQFAVNGAAVLFRSGVADTYAGRLDAQGEAFFNAVVASIENPEVYGEAGKYDWALASAALVQNGGSEADLQRIAASDPRDPQLCNTIGNFFLILASLDRPFSRRLMADFAPSITGY